MNCERMCILCWAVEYTTIYARSTQCGHEFEILVSYRSATILSIELRMFGCSVRHCACYAYCLHASLTQFGHKSAGTTDGSACLMYLFIQVSIFNRNGKGADFFCRQFCSRINVCAFDFDCICLFISTFVIGYRTDVTTSFMSYTILFHIGDQQGEWCRVHLDSNVLTETTKNPIPALGGTRAFSSQRSWFFSLIAKPRKKVHLVGYHIYIFCLRSLKIEPNLPAVPFGSVNSA